MSRLKNDRLLRALLRREVDMTPVWIMRQAGRYLPEYRDTRKQAGSFLKLCQTPELACEVTLQPLRRFALDAAILFSDILTVPDAMGLGLRMVENEGPSFESPVRSRTDIDRLRDPDPETDLGYVMDAVRLIKRELNGDVPLIGFAGSPWTIATYMVEGGSSREYGMIKALLYDNSADMHRLLDLVSTAVTAYLNAQIDAGVDVVQLFDTWGGILSPAAYREFSLQYMEKIIGGLRRERDGQTVPVILFSKGCGNMVKDIIDTGSDAIGLDWTVDIGDMRERSAGRAALQGNLDPGVLYAGPDIIRQQVSGILESYGHGPGHVFNLGHGIHPQINPDHVAVLVDAVHELSKPFHRDSGLVT